MLTVGGIQYYISTSQRSYTVPTSLSGDGWMLEQGDGLGTTLAEQQQALQNARRSFEGAIVRNVEIPEVAELQKTFSGKLLVTFYSAVSGGVTKFVAPEGMTIDDIRRRMENKDSMLEVVIYGKKDKANPRFQQAGLLFYDSEWRAVIYPALQYSDQVQFDALALHEMWHAYKDRKGAVSAHRPLYDDLWIDEELEAHDLEGSVLHLGTKGRFFAAVTKIAMDSRATTPNEFLNSLTPELLQPVASLFQPAHEYESSVRIGEYYLMAGREWLRHHPEGDPKHDFHTRYREFYRALLKANQ